MSERLLHLIQIVSVNQIQICQKYLHSIVTGQLDDD